MSRLQKEIDTSPPRDDAAGKVIEPGSGKRGMPKRSVLAARQQAYLTALRDGVGVSEALVQTGLKSGNIAAYRRQSKNFRDEEALLLGVRPVDTMQADYLDGLVLHYGNVVKARKRAGMPPRVLERFRKDAEFVEREQEVLAGHVAEIEEQAICLAAGGKSKIRDAGHTRAVLAKLVPDRWGDAPRQVEHRFSGNITVSNTDDEILRLMGKEALGITADS